MLNALLDSESKKVEIDPYDDIRNLGDNSKCKYDFYFTVRTQNILEAANIISIRELVSIPDERILKLPNAGKKTLEEIKALRNMVNADRGV